MKLSHTRPLIIATGILTALAAMASCSSSGSSDGDSSGGAAGAAGATGGTTSTGGMGFGAQAGSGGTGGTGASSGSGGGGTGGGGTVQCGGQMCMPLDLSMIDAGMPLPIDELPACCATMDRCGIDLGFAAGILGLEDPCVAEEDLLDVLAPDGGQMDGGPIMLDPSCSEVNIMAPGTPGAEVLPGCCTVTGQCGGATNNQLLGALGVAAGCFTAGELSVTLAMLPGGFTASGTPGSCMFGGTGGAGGGGGMAGAGGASGGAAGSGGASGGAGGASGGAGGTSGASGASGSSGSSGSAGASGSSNP